MSNNIDIWWVKPRSRDCMLYFLAVLGVKSANRLPNHHLNSMTRIDLFRLSKEYKAKMMSGNLIVREPL